MFRESRRSLHSWSRRAVLYPAFGVLTLVAPGRRDRDRHGSDDEQPASTRWPHLSRRRPSPLPALHRCRVAGCRLVQRPWGAHAELGMGARRCRAPDSGLRLRSRGRGMERSGRQADRTPINSPMMCTAFSRLPMFQGPTSSRVTRWAAPTHSPTQWIIQGTWLVSRSSTRLPLTSSIYRGIRPSTPLRAARPGLLPPLARAGVVRVYIDLTGSQLPAGARSQAQTFASSPRELNADRVEFAELPTVLRQDKALTSLDGKPLFVLTADVGQQSGWFAAQNRLAALSTNSAHQTTHGATHQALLEDRRYAAVTARAIEAVVRAVRTGHTAIDMTSNEVNQLQATESSAESEGRYDVLVIGAGQAGLTVGYYLKQAGLTVPDRRRGGSASARRGGNDGSRSSCSRRADTTPCRASRSTATPTRSRHVTR